MISVVIPAYQAVPYISDTIRSVQSQTLPWETDKLELQWKASKLCPEAAVVLDDSTKDGEHLILYRG